MKKIVFSLLVAVTLLLSSTAAFAGGVADWYERGGPTYKSSHNYSAKHTVPPPRAANQSSRNVIMQNVTTKPSDMTVPQGTTVTWVNQSARIQNIASNTSNGPMSGYIQPGQSYSRAFNTPGSYPYHYMRYPNRQGTITVTKTPPVPPNPGPVPQPPANNSSSSTATSSATATVNTYNTYTVPPKTTTQPASSVEPTTVPVQYTPTAAAAPASATLPAAAPSALPNTGAVGAGAAFILASSVGAIAYYLYARHKASKV